MLLLVSDLEAPGGRDADLAYIRVAEDIGARIASGELAPGARLRSERDLAEFYGVSYGTVRRAMEVLRERELITTIHGRGTFVRAESLTPKLRAPSVVTALASVAALAQACPGELPPWSGRSRRAVQPPGSRSRSPVALGAETAIRRAGRETPP
jgi:GntR family transcriptional regulator